MEGDSNFPVGTNPEALRPGPQPLPLLSREAVARIEQAEEDAKARYAQDKWPHFPTNPDFSFSEVSIRRAMESIIHHLTILAQEVLDAHWREYLAVAPADILHNETLKLLVANRVYDLPSELWRGYRRTLWREPSRRNRVYPLALAARNLDQYPELEPCRYPDPTTWEKIFQEAQPEIERLDAIWQTSLQKVAVDGFKRYQRNAAAKLAITLTEREVAEAGNLAAQSSAEGNIDSARELAEKTDEATTVTTTERLDLASLDKRRFHRAIEQYAEELHSRPVEASIIANAKLMLEHELKDLASLRDVATPEEARELDLRMERMRVRIGQLEKELAPLPDQPLASKSAQTASQFQTTDYVSLLEKVLEQRGGAGEAKTKILALWLSEHPGLSRTQVTDYLAGRIERRVSAAKCKAIEDAILASAHQLGLTTRSDSD